MRRRWSTLVGTFVFAAAPLLHGQKATERFIPIGKSPGLSGKVTILGDVAAVDAAARTLTVENRTIKVTEATRIWLDRTRAQKPVEDGRFEDLKPGVRVEIKLREQEPKDAEWVKVEVAS